MSQEDRRGERDFHSIVLTIHKKGGKKAKRMNELLCPMDSYTNLRTRTVEIPRMEPGVYTLVPSTFDPDMEASFRIEVYASEPCSLVEAT